MRRDGSFECQVKTGENCCLCYIVQLCLPNPIPEYNARKKAVAKQSKATRHDKLAYAAPREGFQDEDRPESLESELARRISPLKRPTMLGRRAFGAALRVGAGGSRGPRSKTKRREASAMMVVTMRGSAGCIKVPIQFETYGESRRCRPARPKNARSCAPAGRVRRSRRT